VVQEEEEEESKLRDEIKTLDAALKKAKKHTQKQSLAVEPSRAKEHVVGLTTDASAGVGGLLGKWYFHIMLCSHPHAI